jgi:glyceraldehyde 3-phosphate dehydrogenase
MKRVAINGFGRVGRAFFRLAFGHPEIEIVAVNDPYFPKKQETVRYLLKHDSVYGRYDKAVEATEEELRVDGKPPVRIERREEPDELPWGEMKVDLVVEASGVFRAYNGREGAARHLAAGAKRVLQTVPSKGEGADRIPQVVYGVNHKKIDAAADVVSAASCTTNSVVPVMHVLEEMHIGIVHAFLTTIHGYTADQKIVDGAHKALTRGRAAAINIVPTTTGAAIATGKVIRSLEGKMDGIAFRVPVVTGSVSDITVETEKPVKKGAVNDTFRRYAAEGDLAGILGVSEDPMVSTDIIADPRPSVVDPSLTQVVDDRLLKVVAFYDNEWGYTNQLLRLALIL